MSKSDFNTKNNPQKVLYNALMIVLVMFFFLLSLKLMESSFKLFGKDVANEIINSTSNPFVSLFIGLLATAIIQSSSTTTTMIVTMVATSALSIENAVPMIMGANIGTSVTSSIVSLGHIGKKKEYKKAVSAATVHDFFNIMVVLILFPLEYFFNLLTKLATSIAIFFTAGEPTSEEMFSLLGVTVKPVSEFIISMVNKNPWFGLLIAIILLFFSLRYLTLFLKKLLIGKAEKKMDKLIFSKPAKALGWGAILTMAVQSSSVTTSLIVPLVASNKVSLRKAFPFLIGANIGTTITSLIAAMATDSSVFRFALTIALVHVLFNVLGAVFIFPIKFLREIPVKLSRKLGQATMKNRLVGMAYIVITFFLIPFLLIMVSNNKSAIIDYRFENKNKIENTISYTVIEDELSSNSNAIQRKYYLNLDTLSYPVNAKPTIEKTVITTKNTLEIGDEIYLLSSIGYCFDREEIKGKTKLCLNDIKMGLKINEKTINSCYIYQKTYYNLAIVDSIYEMIYLDIDKKLVVKKEVFNKNGKNIYTQEIL